MPVPSPAEVISHWSNLLENLQLSPLDFYAAVEQAVKRREVPNASISRIDWNEGGVFTAKREYLRVERGRHVFDICGAPFGTGFFVSTWLARPKSGSWPIAVFLLLGAAAFAFFAFISIFGALIGPFAFLVGYPIIFFIFVLTMNDSSPDWDDAIVAIPVFGAIYQRIFRPETYYRVDTALMFQKSVHNAVLEVVDQMTTAQGARALSELERKPILRQFAKAAGE